MGEFDDLIEAGREAEERLAALSPEENLASAQVLRDAKPRLQLLRQREIAEEMAQGFDARAAELIGRRPAPRLRRL